MPRVCMLGLDCLAPDLLFSRFWRHLPHLRGLVERGAAGPLRSCDPPITVPAWATMLTGHDPGSLGVYGFHDRADYSYHRRRLASSLSYHQPPLWRLPAAAGLRSRVIAIPQTYPPQPLNGYMVTGSLTPPSVGVATYPAELRDEVLATLRDGSVDIPEFRQLHPAELLRQVQRNSERLFGLLQRWLAADDWDFLAMVDMGADRLHHGLWRTCIPDHPHFIPHHPLQHALRDYYVQLDTHVGQLVQALRPDDVLLVVSDHGAQAMHGTFAVNQWLHENGWLHLLADPPQAPTPWDPTAIDWPRSRAWADGGYASRLYINLQGREPAGCVAPHAYEATLAELEAAVAAAPRLPHTGAHRCLRPRDIYRACRGVPPDLLVYWGDLKIRGIASLGHSSLLGQLNDRGPDGANHARDGVFILADDQGPRPARHYSIYDVAPTVLKHLGLPADPSMVGVAA